MAIKRVLLPFCDTAGFGPIMEGAFVIGQIFSAQVYGLFAQRLHVELPITSENVRPDTLQQILEKAQTEQAGKLKQAEEMFQACAKQFSHVASEFAAKDEAIADTVSHAARLADISVLASGAYYEKEDWQNVRDAVLFNSGRPVMLIPPGGVNEQSFDRVVIAWKESVEAARAVAAAQRFLQHAKEAHLTTIGEGAKSIASLQDIEQYLQLHHSELRTEVIPASKGSRTGEILLAKTVELGGGLLVMGAYSHRRWRERIFGGVTEHILREARTPVLLAH